MAGRAIALHAPVTNHAALSLNPGLMASSAGQPGMLVAQRKVRVQGMIEGQPGKTRGVRVASRAIATTLHLELTRVG